MQRSLYGLKQFGWMWYYHLNEYLLKEDYIFSCVFIKKFECKFIIITICVYDSNITGAYEKLPKVVNFLKKEFEMKYFEEVMFSLGL